MVSDWRDMDMTWERAWSSMVVLVSVMRWSAFLNCPFNIQFI
jgi:hypothetical protein